MFLSGTWLSYLGLKKKEKSQMVLMFQVIAAETKKCLRNWSQPNWITRVGAGGGGTAFPVHGYVPV